MYISVYKYILVFNCVCAISLAILSTGLLTVLHKLQELKEKTNTVNHKHLFDRLDTYFDSIISVSNCILTSKESIKC